MPLVGAGLIPWSALRIRRWRGWCYVTRTATGTPERRAGARACLCPLLRPQAQRQAPVAEGKMSILSMLALSMEGRADALPRQKPSLWERMGSSS